MNINIIALSKTIKNSIKQGNPVTIPALTGIEFKMLITLISSK